MAVVIRMKRMGRKHRSFFRICAADSRSPRDGRVIEEVGTYDPLVPDTDARVTFNDERIKYWLGVGALPSEKVAILIKKYGANGTHAAQQKAAKDKLALPKGIPDPGKPKFVLQPKSETPPAAEASPAPAEAAPAEPPAGDST